jgi:hypothetical protein
MGPPPGTTLPNGCPAAQDGRDREVTARWGHIPRVQIRPRELRARRQSEFVANPVEEVDLGKPDQAGPLRSGIDADPIAGVEHAAQLTIHTHRDLARPLEHPNPDTFVACGQHEAAIEHRLRGDRREEKRVQSRRDNRTTSGNCMRSNRLTTRQSTRRQNRRRCRDDLCECGGSDHPVNSCVIRAPHLAHAAAAQQLDQAVAAERSPVHPLTIGSRAVH